MFCSNNKSQWQTIFNDMEFSILLTILALHPWQYILDPRMPFNFKTLTRHKRHRHVVTRIRQREKTKATILCTLYEGGITVVILCKGKCWHHVNIWQQLLPSTDNADRYFFSLVSMGELTMTIWNCHCYAFVDVCMYWCFFMSNITTPLKSIV